MALKRKLLHQTYTPFLDLVFYLYLGLLQIFISFGPKLVSLGSKKFSASIGVILCSKRHPWRQENKEIISFWYLASSDQTGASYKQKRNPCIQTAFRIKGNLFSSTPLIVFRAILLLWIWEFTANQENSSETVYSLNTYQLLWFLTEISEVTEVQSIQEGLNLWKFLTEHYWL